MWTNRIKARWCGARYLTRARLVWNGGEDTNKGCDMRVTLGTASQVGGRCQQESADMRSKLWLVLTGSSVPPKITILKCGQQWHPFYTPRSNLIVYFPCVPGSSLVIVQSLCVNVLQHWSVDVKTANYDMSYKYIVHCESSLKHQCKPLLKGINNVMAKLCCCLHDHCCNETSAVL